MTPDPPCGSSDTPAARTPTLASAHPHRLALTRHDRTQRQTDSEHRTDVATRSTRPARTLEDDPADVPLPCSKSPPDDVSFRPHLREVSGETALAENSLRRIPVGVARCLTVTTSDEREVASDVSARDDRSVHRPSPFVHLCAQQHHDTETLRSATTHRKARHRRAAPSMCSEEPTGPPVSTKARTAVGRPTGAAR